MKISMPNEDVQIDVRFRYDEGLSGVWRTVACIKMTIAEQTIEFIGEAIKSDLDQHCRRVGRKVALARAFQHPRFVNDKALKTAIWRGLQKRGMKL